MDFILFIGDKNSLSEAEVSAQIPDSQPLGSNKYFFSRDNHQQAIDLSSKLGCSIKLLSKLDISSLDPKVLLSQISTPLFSLCSLPPEATDKALSHQIKDLSSIKLRFIEPKNEFGVTPVISHAKDITELFLDRSSHSVYKTIWAHDFNYWIKKDRGLPYANTHAGILPPKIARSLVNLVPFQSGILLDPFCGSGRILVEAVELGYQVIGSDISSDQIDETLANLNALDYESTLIHTDATHLSESINQPVDIIVTEPYMGKTNFRPDRAKYIAQGLKKLYLGCLKDWHKFLKTKAKIVMIFPVLCDENKEYPTSTVIDDQHLLGYNVTTRGIYYFRPGAKVKREIIILEKN